MGLDDFWYISVYQQLPISCFLGVCTAQNQLLEHSDTGKHGWVIWEQRCPRATPSCAAVTFDFSRKKYQFAQTEIFISLISSACCWPGHYRSKVNWYCRILPLKWPQGNTAWSSGKSVTNSCTVPSEHSQAKEQEMHAPLWKCNASSSDAR